MPTVKKKTKKPEPVGNKKVFEKIIKTVVEKKKITNKDKGGK